VEKRDRGKDEEQKEELRAGKEKQKVVQTLPHFGRGPAGDAKGIQEIQRGSKSLIVPM